MSHYAPCREWRELLSAYQDDELSTGERDRVAEHLAGCAACEQALAKLEADRARFVDAYAASTAGAELKASVIEEVRTMSPSESPIPAGWLRWLAGLAAAAALCSVIALVVALAGMRAQPPVVLAPGQQSKVQEPGDVPYGYSGDLIRNGAEARKPALGFMGGGFMGGPAGAREGGKDAVDNVRSVFLEPQRNYGIPGGIKMAYDANLRLQVKDALRAAQASRKVIIDRGGFIIDFAYDASENQTPGASIRGKVPATEAEAALAAIEKLGRLRVLNIAGEDLTEAYQRQLDEIERENEHAQKLQGQAKGAGARGHDWAARQAEMQRAWAEERAKQARRALHGLVARHDLVEFSAAFTERAPREPVTFSQVVTGTRRILGFALLLLGTLAVLVAILCLLALPWVAVRCLRGKGKPQRDEPAA